MNQAKHAALTCVNYDNVDYRKKKKDGCMSHSSCLFCDTAENTATALHTPQALSIQAARVVSKQSDEYIKEAVLSYLPTCLVTTLLRQTILNRQDIATDVLISNWPIETLCFMEIVPDKPDLFSEQMHFDLTVFKGVIGRTKHCKLKTLDFRGFTLNSTFTRLVVQMWPLLSLKKYHRNVNKLAKLVVKESGLNEKTALANEIIHKEIKNIQDISMMKHPTFAIQMPRNTRMQVLIDRAEFSTENTFFLDYVITSCLRSLTSVTVIVSNIIVRSELNIGDDISDSLAPFIVFKAQDPETVSGICLDGLEGNVFNAMCNILHRFTNVSRLSLQDCNISLEAGRTRRCTNTRVRLCSLLSTFKYLTRLDLSENSLAGCLGEVLNGLEMPLQYLSLRNCDIFDSDVTALSESKHANSLRELNLTKVCGLFAYDRFAVTPQTLIKSLTSRQFTMLTVVTLVHNQLTDAHMHTLCVALRAGCWHKLRMLNISDNMLTADAVLQVVHACCVNGAGLSTPELQCLHVPYTHTLLDVAEHARHNFALRIYQVLKESGRDDVMVYVTTSTYAVFFH